MSQKKITIPTDIEGVKADLNGVGVLITAKEWHRAAVVASFVTLSEHGGDRTKGKRSSALAPKEFAALGIHGLKSDNTVRQYVKAWTETAGLEPPAPGEEITLPDIEWPPSESAKTSTNTPEKVLASIAKDPEKTAEAMDRLAAAQPKAAAKVAAKAIKTDEGRKAVAKEMVKDPEATAEFIKAENEHYAEDDEARKIRASAARVKATEAAKEAADAEALATSGELTVAALTPLMIAVQSTKQFLDTAESVDYRADEDTQTLLRKYAERYRDYAVVLEQIANGSVSATISDEDLEALLGAS